MEAMPQQIVFSIVLLTAGFAASISLTKPNSTSADKSEVERGRYLVEEVAKCPKCHTPRNARGELDREAWLQGATIRPIGNRPYRHDPLPRRCKCI